MACGKGYGKCDSRIAKKASEGLNSERMLEFKKKTNYN
jgi:hypothetical protein